MKILLIGFAKIKYMPYINLYLDNLDRDKNDIHVIYWNRDLKNESLDTNKITYHEFKYYQEDNVSRLSKLKSFFNFKRFAKNNIKKEKYDFIICMHTFPAVLLKNELIHNYKNKYIFDYRDYTYEKIIFFKNVVGNIVKSSLYTFVSSDNYRDYLPNNCKEKIITSHNVLKNELNLDINNIEKIENDRIRIAFWGFIREEKINLQIIKQISKDSRFELHYYGREQQTALNLKKYVSEHKIDNVFFHGEYKPSDRIFFANKTDLIHNLYETKNMMICVGNKMYDGIIFKIPQLCMLNSYMGKKCSNQGIGLECNPYEDDFTNKIFLYYKRLEQKKFINNCEKVLKNVKNECNVIYEIIKSLH